MYTSTSSLLGPYTTPKPHWEGRPKYAPHTTCVSNSCRWTTLSTL